MPATNHKGGCTRDNEVDWVRRSGIGTKSDRNSRDSRVTQNPYATPVSVGDELLDVEDVLPGAIFVVDRFDPTGRTAVLAGPADDRPDG